MPRRKAPIEAAIPKQTVLTSHGMNCIVSKIAMPLEMEPPTENVMIMKMVTMMMRMDDGEIEGALTGTVNVHGDIRSRVLIGKIQQLCYNGICHIVIDGFANHDDSFIHQRSQYILSD